MKTPKEIKDFLNNKVLANISGNIPKIETISIDNFLEWFKSGVLIPNEFYYLKEDNWSWVIQFKEFIDGDDNPICYYYMLKIHDNDIISDCSCANNGWIKATPAQKQLLIDKVEGETDKTWNEQTKSFEDKPKEILVPECIKIIKYQNDQLGLVFNNHKQVLTFSEGVYIVLPLDKWDKFISCRLEKTTFEELHEGDVFFQRENPCDEIIFYSIKKDKQNYVYIADTDVNVAEIDSQIIYKVIPIK